MCRQTGFFLATITDSSTHGSFPQILKISSVLHHHTPQCFISSTSFQPMSPFILHVGHRAANDQQVQHSGSSQPRMQSPRAASLTAKQAMAADHMQLLDLVEVLITDHRTSLLERKRLQQQLDSTQQALQAERISKERAAALADLR